MNIKNKNKVCVFFDTMVFLHCKPIQQMDLPKLLCVNSVTIVIPRVILQELDKHKNTHKSRKIRERVVERMKTIQSCVASASKKLRSSVFLQLETTRPSRNFEKQGLNINWPDDQLLASLLSYKQKHPSDRVILISHDVGPQLTAMHLGIEAIELPELWRIPPEEDPLIQENKRLKNELLKLQSTQPQLILRLSEMQDDEEHVVFRLSPPTPIEIPDKINILYKLRESYPELHPPEPNGPMTQQISKLISLSQIPKSEYERYNQELKQYFCAYERYLDRLVGYRTQPDRTIRLLLEIRNIGTAPAEDVDIYVNFPDGFSLYTKEDLPEEPKEPLPPIKPKSEAQKLFFPKIPNLGIHAPLFNVPSFTEETFSLRRTKSYELREHFDRIKHGYINRIRPIFLVFNSFDEANSFNFEYEITLGNLPKSISGRLHVSIEKENR